MTIQWLGQACFKITYDGYSIVIDPYHEEMSGFSPMKTSADKVLVSHQHLGHNNVEAVQLSGTSRECPFQIETIQTHHDTLNGRMRGENLIHILTAGGRKLIHMGDVGIQQDDDRLRNADVIMSHCGSLRRNAAGPRSESDYSDALPFPRPQQPALFYTAGYV